MTSRSVALLALVAVFGLTIAPLVSGAVVVPFADDTGTESNSNATVSTFMQSNAADTENTVDAELFTKRYEGAENESRETLVLERTDDLVERLETLEAERAELRERRDELHPGEYRARMTRFTVEIRALEREIDRTERRANETDVDADRLEALRTDAANLSGPEVAEIARELGGPDAVPGRGPPDDRSGNGPPDDRTGNGPPAERDDGTPGNGQGQSAERSPGQNEGGPSGAADDGSSADPGPPDETGTADRERSGNDDNGPAADGEQPDIAADGSTTDSASPTAGGGDDSSSDSDSSSSDEDSAADSPGSA